MSVIQCEAVFRRRKNQNKARIQARNYFRAAQQTALQRRLLERMLNRDSGKFTPHFVE